MISVILLVKILVVVYIVKEFLIPLYKSYTFKPLPAWKGKRQVPGLEQWTKETPMGDRKPLKCINPGTGEQLCEPLPTMTPADVKQRVAIAREQQKEWAKTSFEERRYVLNRLADEVLNQKHQIISASAADSGKTLLEACLGEILTSCAKIRHLCQYGEQYLQREYRSVPLFMITKSAYVEYNPCGVVGMIVPGNYPFHNVLGSIVTALMSGNGVVVKPSEYTTWCVVSCYAKIFDKVLTECGYNPDIIQFVIGFGDVGEALIRSPVDHVFFIGSPETGKRVMRTAADYLTPVTLELGGKDPFIFCEDTEMERAIDYATRSIFLNCGQNCIAAERYYVHEKIYDEFVKQVVAYTKKMTQGATCLSSSFDVEPSQVYDCGAMTMQIQIDKINELVQDAVKKGAKLETGGEQVKGTSGIFYPPTILSNVTHEMRIAKEEAFGPVMLVIKWQTDDQVAKMANDTEYGLGSYVFCKDLKRAERIVNQIDAGVSMVNDYGLFYVIQELPFGGVNKSGFGKFNGREGLRAFCKQKSVVTDRFAGLSMAIPKVIRYPIQTVSHIIVGEFLSVIFHSSISEKCKSLVAAVKALLKSK